MKKSLRNIRRLEKLGGKMHVTSTQKLKLKKSLTPATFHNGTHNGMFKNRYYIHSEIRSFYRISGETLEISSNLETNRIELNYSILLAS
jgi:hypothetical protein